MPIYNNKLKPIQYIKGDPYLIHATFPIDKMTDVSAMKNFLGVSSAFKHSPQGIYFFCEKIEEAELIE